MESRNILKRLAVLLFFLASAVGMTTRAVDTDGDGVTDTDEIAAGTLPNNAQSVQWKSLASWRFTDGTLNGDDGQQPIAQSNVTVVTNGFLGAAAQLLPCSID